jgi:GR25 family glycosyltransferase involved in LPS biosynthesis
MKIKTKKNNKKKINKQKGGGLISLNDIRFVCISLEERDDKYSYFKKLSNKLSNMNIKLEKFSGIDTRSLDTRILSLIPNLDNFISNNKGEIGDNYYTVYQDEIINRRNLGSLGCGLSHCYLYKRMIEKNIPFMFILEEDAIIYNNFGKKIKQILSNAPNDWDLIFFGMSCAYDHDERCHKNDNMKTHGNNLYEVKYIYGTYGYLINLKGALKIIDNVFPIWWHLDTLLSNFINSGILKIYTVIPNLVFHPGKFQISSKNYLTYTDYDEYDSAIKSKDIKINNI